MKWIFCDHKDCSWCQLEENIDVHHISEHSEFVEIKEVITSAGHQTTVQEEAESKKFMNILSMFGPVYNFIHYAVTLVCIVLAPMITCMLIWFRFDREKWCGVNYNHIKNQENTPVGHPNKTSNPRRDTEVKQGPHISQGLNYTVKSPLRLIKMRLNGSLGPTDKYRAKSRLPFVWKRKIMHVISRLMAMKPVSTLISAQAPVGDCEIEVVPQTFHLFHGDIMCTMNTQHRNSPTWKLNVFPVSFGIFGKNFAMSMWFFYLLQGSIKMPIQKRIH